jgi:hypothetical protein
MTIQSTKIHPRVLQYLLLINNGRNSRFRAAYVKYSLRKKQSFSVVGRSPNLHRNRVDPLSKMDLIDDSFFKRLYRLDRPTFNWLLNMIRPILENKSTIQKGINSSGSVICAKLKLAIALRFLAGGIYLDIAWGYNISYKHISLYVWQL